MMEGGGYDAEHLRAQQRLKLAQARILEHASVALTLEELYRDIVLLIEAEDLGIRCSILRADNLRGVLHDAVAPSLPAEYNACVENLPIAEGSGSCGTAAARRTSVVVTDVQTDPLWARFVDLARLHEGWLRGCWSTPFFDSQKELLGTFAVYFSELRGPTEFERELVEFAARLSGVVTERHLTVKALRDSEALHRAIFDATPEAIVTIDRNGTVLAFNHAAERMFGYSVVEVLGRPVAMLMEADVAAHHQGYVARHVPGNSPVRLHRGRAVQARRKDGSQFPVETTISEVVLHDQTCYTAMLHDVSELAAADEARRANRAKSEFLARMSHELRTPLNAILGFAQLIDLESKELDAHGRERLSHITEAGRHLLDLINEVLDLATIEAGRVKFELGAVALQPLLADCVRLIDPAARARNIACTLAFAHGAPTHARADSKRLRQVLVNLLSNAVKYNVEGGSIEVTVQALPPEGVDIVVRDTGPGLDPTALQRIFEPFERLGQERGNVEGTGIGLAIARGLVRDMGGGLSVTSAPGSGCTFNLVVPMARAEDAPVPVEPADAADSAAASAAGAVGPALVLYIEDNPVGAMLVSAYCKQMPNVRCEVARTGAEGIARALQLKPDLVLCDMRLPDLTGHQVLASLRANPALAKTPCVVLSANAMTEDIAAARAAGFDDYWTKPIAPQEFRTKVSRMLRRR